MFLDNGFAKEESLLVTTKIKVRATENELLEDYLKLVDLLSINDDRLILQKQVNELAEKSKDKECH